MLTPFGDFAILLGSMHTNRCLFEALALHIPRNYGRWIKTLVLVVYNTL
jgi:hypothetical protein